MVSFNGEEYINTSNNNGCLKISTSISFSLIMVEYILISTLRNFRYEEIYLLITKHVNLLNFRGI